ncbi:MAG: murein biosynthesis integral membrane protein MurJ [Gemmatimonadota bacterium]
MTKESAGGRAAMVVGAGILLSRLVGLARGFVISAYFGAGAESDAYTAALRIPNTLRNLLGEGAMSASFVPVYSRMLAQGEERASRALAGAVLGLLMLLVSGLTLLGIAFAPVLTDVLADGFAPAQQELITKLVRILFPMTAVMVLSGWCLGIQNSHRRFFWSYASAAMWSIAQIALLLGWGSRESNLVTLAEWLAWATLGGAVLQVLVQLPEVIKLVGPIRPTLQRNATGVSDVLRNVVPVMLALGVAQISGLIDLQIASHLSEGSTTLVSYASLVALLPVGLFGVSIAASALPDLARDTTGRSLDGLRERLRGGWQRILFYIVPSAVACIVLGDYLIGILYRVGKFTAEDQRIGHWILAGYAVGMVSVGSVKLMSSAYYALQDYRTPLRSSMLSVVVSAAAAAGLAFNFRESPLAAAGIALGAALGSYVNLTLLLAGLRKRLGPLYTPAMWRGTRRIALAALAAGAVGFGLHVLQERQWPTVHPRIVGPPILVAFGVTYLLVAWLLGSAEASRWLRLRPRAVDRPEANGRTPA